MTKTILLTTPMISVNKMYRGRRFLSKDGKDTKYAISLEILAMGRFEPQEGTIALDITFHVSNNRADIDNMLKALLDCMTGTIYKDDSQIVELHCYKKVDKQNPRTEITIKTL